MNNTTDESVLIEDQELIRDLRWLTTALPGKEEHRDFLKFIQVYGNKIVTADGHRIHKLETTWIPEGSYTITKNTKRKMILVRASRISDVALSDRIRNIINDHLGDSSGKPVIVYPLSNDQEKRYVWSESTDEYLFVKVYRKLEKDYHYRYLAEALQAFQTTATQIWENETSIRIKGERREAVVMNIRV